MIYLDNATAMKPSETALAAMWPFYETLYASPSSPYSFAQELLPTLEKAAKQIGKLVAAKESDHMVFTSSQAEAVHLVVQTVYREVSQRTGKIHFVTSTVEDASIMLALSALEEESCLLSCAEVDKLGRVTLESISEAISPRTALISLSLASGLTGVVQPVSDIAKLCKERGILLHLDVTHACGKLNLDFEELGAAFITFGGEQIGAPRGTGALFSRGIKPVSLTQGAPLNTALLVAFGQAALEAENNSVLYGTEVARLRALFEETLFSTCPFAKGLLQDAERLPNISVLAFEGIFNEALLFQLSRKRVYATIGGGPFQAIDLVLKASGIDPVTANSALSFALSKETRERDVIQAATLIGEAATKMRRLSKSFI